jgi:hypothetical protein
VGDLDSRFPSQTLTFCSVDKGGHKPCYENRRSDPIVISTTLTDFREVSTTG